MPNGSFLKVIGFGIVGGVAGTVLMDIVMVVTFLLAGQPWDTFFTMIGEKFGDGTLVGILVHNLVGLTGGFVFSLLVFNV
jgi:hypothetical protein